MSNKVAAHVLVNGMVQGVGYRYFARQAALAHGIDGWVRNRPDGAVELEVQGERQAVEKYIQEIREGPRFARVTHLETEWKETDPRLEGFGVKF